MPNEDRQGKSIGLEASPCGGNSTPGSIKPIYLEGHGHEVLSPAPSYDFNAAIRIAHQRSFTSPLGKSLLPLTNCRTID